LLEEAFASSYLFSIEPEESFFKRLLKNSGPEVFLKLDMVGASGWL